MAESSGPTASRASPELPTDTAPRWRMAPTAPRTELPRPYRAAGLAGGRRGGAASHLRGLLQGTGEAGEAVNHPARRPRYGAPGAESVVSRTTLYAGTGRWKPVRGRSGRRSAATSASTSA
jgi:hypothetical protein